MNQQHLHHHHHQQQQQHAFAPAQNESPASYCDMYYHPVNQPLRVTSVQAEQPLPRHHQVDNNIVNQHHHQQQFISAYDHHPHGGLINDGFGQQLDDSSYATSMASKQSLVYEHQTTTNDAALYDYNNQMFLHDQMQANDRLSGAQTVAYHDQLDRHVQDSLGPSVFGDEQTIGFGTLDDCGQQIHYMSTSSSQPNEVLAADQYLSPVTGQAPHSQHATLTQQHHHSPQFSIHNHQYQTQQHFEPITSGYMTTMQPNSISNQQQINEGSLVAQNNESSYDQQYTMQRTLLPDETPDEQYTNQIEPAAQVFYQPTEVTSAAALPVESKHQTAVQSQANQRTVNTQQRNGSLIDSRAMLDLEDHLLGQQQDARHMSLNVSQQQKPVAVVTKTVSATSKNNVVYTEPQLRGQLQSNGLVNSALCRLQTNLVTSPHAKNEDQLMTTRQPNQNSNLAQQQRQQQELTASRGCVNLTQDRMDFICEKLIGDMDHFGICVIDNFLGSINGEMILKEVQQLYSSGQYTKGRLVNNKVGKVDDDEKATEGGDLIENNTSLANGFSGSNKSATSASPKGIQSGLASSPSSSMTTTNSSATAIASAKTADTRLATKQVQLDASGAIRSDRVIWIDGCEDGCSEINNLIQTLCSVITNSSRLSLYSNNRLDKIVINKRTKAHVACYPGNGTRYIKHVDNPNGDGRVITAIYYLNKDWNTERDGGLLRMFPAGMDRVANIEPLFDRALFFWSDRRNPHEVLPAFRDRFAITVWYIGENRI